MKRLLSIAILTVLSATAALPLSAAAQTRVHVSINAHAPVHIQERQYERYVPARQSHIAYAYAPSARDTRHGGYIAPRRWVDRNHDGMDDRRGRRDVDRDGIPDRYDRDLDNDGIANRYDRDVDGDGVSNRRDRRPDNQYAY